MSWKLTYLYLTLGSVDCYVYYDSDTYEVLNIVADPYNDEQDLSDFNSDDYKEDIEEALVSTRVAREKTIAQLAKRHLVR